MGAKEEVVGKFIDTTLQAIALMQMGELKSLTGRFQFRLDFYTKTSITSVFPAVFSFVDWKPSLSDLQQRFGYYGLDQYENGEHRSQLLRVLGYGSDGTLRSLSQSREAVSTLRGYVTKRTTNTEVWIFQLKDAIVTDVSELTLLDTSPGPKKVNFREPNLNYLLSLYFQYRKATTLLDHRWSPLG
jgi:hypothetical protein